MARWFRHYEGMNADPVFGGVARRCKTSRATVVFVYSSLCELEAACEGLGYVFDADAIADLMGVETDLVIAIHADLERLGKVEDGHVCSFTSRNYLSDSSTERSRRHRQRKRNVASELRNAPETETETDIPLKPPRGAVGASKSKSKTPEPPTFTPFFAAMPKRVARGAALRAYRSALSRASPDEILAGAKQYAAECSGKEPKYIAHPATWLNGDRWMDYDAPPEQPQTIDDLRAHRARLVKLGLSTERTDEAIERMGAAA